MNGDSWCLRKFFIVDIVDGGTKNLSEKNLVIITIFKGVIVWGPKEAKW